MQRIAPARGAWARPRERALSCASARTVVRDLAGPMTTARTTASDKTQDCDAQGQDGQAKEDASVDDVLGERALGRGRAAGCGAMQIG